MSDALVVGRPGGDLLSRVLGRSTIGAEGFHGRVRDGIGCIAPRNDHQVVEQPGRSARCPRLRASARGEIRVNEVAVVVLSRSPRDLLIAACDGSF